MQSFWDLAYRDGDFRDHWELPYPSPALAAIVAAEMVPSGATALDAGCGGGRDAIFLAESGFKAIGVDRSGEALRVARHRAAAAGVEVDWWRSDVLNLPLPDASIALVNDRGCFHGLGAESRRRYGRELARILAPGGLLLLCGAAREDEEGGLAAVDAPGVDGVFPAPAFSRGPVVPTTLPAPAGDLDGNLVLLRRASVIEEA